MRDPGFAGGVPGPASLTSTQIPSPLMLPPLLPGCKAFALHQRHWIIEMRTVGHEGEGVPEVPIEVLLLEIDPFSPGLRKEGAETYRLEISPGTEILQDEAMMTRWGHLAAKPDFADVARALAAKLDCAVLYSRDARQLHRVLSPQLNAEGILALEILAHDVVGLREQTIALTRAEVGAPPHEWTVDAAPCRRSDASLTHLAEMTRVGLGKLQERVAHDPSVLHVEMVVACPVLDPDEAVEHRHQGIATAHDDGATTHAAGPHRDRGSRSHSGALTRNLRRLFGRVPKVLR